MKMLWNLKNQLKTIFNSRIVEVVMEYLIIFLNANLKYRTLYTINTMQSNFYFQLFLPKNPLTLMLKWKKYSTLLI